MALPNRLSQREKEAMLHAKMIDWEWQAQKRSQGRRRTAATRRRTLARKDAGLSGPAAV